MGAIFGFSGPPDPVLADRMADVLRHRGRQGAILHAEPHGTLGYHAIFEDALGANAHRIRDGTFHRASEHNATRQLLCNTFGNELRIKLRLAHFVDIDANILDQHADHL